MFHPELGRLLILEQHQCDSAEDAEVGVGVSLPDTAMVFPGRSIQLPVQLALDRPSTLDDRSELLDRHLSAQNRVTDIDAFHSVTLSFTDDHADRLELRPTIAVGQPVWYAADVAPSRFPRAMALVRTVPVADGRCRHLAIQVFGEDLFDSVAQRSLIPFHVEDVVASEARHRGRVCIGRVEVDDEARGELGGAGRRLRPDGKHGNRQGDEGMACDEVEKTGHDRVSSRKL